jgi:hypothetical protein
LVHANGVDLLDFFRGERPWGQLYRLVDALPSWGRYKSQIVMDPEWAKMICDMEDAGKETPPTGESSVTDDEAMSPFGYTPEVSRLDLILDRLQSLESAVMWTVQPDKQREQIQPMPRPETALDRERESRTRSLLEDLDAMFRGEGIALTFGE